MGTRFARGLETAGKIAHVTRVVRAPLFIGLIGGVSLFLPDQTREVYRILAQPSRTHGCTQLAFAVAATLLATLIPWIVGRHLTYLHASDLLRKPNLVGGLSRWLPRVCGAFIPLGLAIGLLIAASEMSFDLPGTVIDSDPRIASVRHDAAAVAFSLRWAAALCLLLAAALLAGTFLRKRRHRNDPSPPLWYSLTAGLVLAGFVVAASVTLSFAPIAIPEAMGALALLLAFIATLVLFVGSLTGYFDRYGVPAVSCIFLLAVFFSAANLNDNHAVQLQPRAEMTLPLPGDSLDRWLDTRNDRDHYGDKPYPVFFVTAAGGGMYAAYHAASVLARLQDRCPNFTQHVFSISAVSGGSVGAAVFSSLAKRHAPNTAHQDCLPGHVPPGVLEQGVQKYFLDADMLAPVVGASLFPDFLQRFLPVKIGRFDRARALEASLADAWRRVAPEKNANNPFEAPFLDHRDALNPGPALILNATDVERGYRVPITPFDIVDLEAISNIPAITKLAEFHPFVGSKARPAVRQFDRDITLSAAVGLSARFPWILPAGHVRYEQSDFRLVDGGYIENSGVETTFDLLRSLQSAYRDNEKQKACEQKLKTCEQKASGQQVSEPPPAAPAHKISVHIISISSLQLVERRSWQGIGEMLSPLRTMLSTRDSRGALAIYRAENFAKDCGACNKDDDQFRVFPLNLLDFPVPLGWQLSPISARLIGLHSGYADRVNDAPGGDMVSEQQAPRIFAYVNMANESSCAVQRILQRPGRLAHC
ncbi:MAG: hypothetical protein QOD11_3450 [Bradyrhizobium sp.]|jgi:hypothetical protein|nr:hypothetical protein [Bradyrhizobium sp.]